MHIDKAKAAQAIAFMLHDTRSCENHTNEKIDSTKSHLNYNLVDGNPLANYHKRMSEVYMRKNKNANVIAMFSTTLPKDFPIERSKEFFEKCHEFYAKRFGSENLISDIVHLDETTPHMHTKFIPVYFNEKRKRDTVSFDEVVPRSVYRSIHKDLKKHLEEYFEFEVAILNGATAGGNKTIAELKTEKIEVRLESLASEVKSKEEFLSQQNKLIEDNEKKIKEQEELIRKNDEYVKKQETCIHHNGSAIEKQRIAYNKLKKQIQELIDAIKPLERLKGMLQAIRTFSYEFRETINEIKYQYMLDDSESKCLDDFWKATDEQDVGLDEAIDVAMKIADDQEYDHNDCDDFEMEM